MDRRELLKRAAGLGICVGVRPVRCGADKLPEAESQVVMSPKTNFEALVSGAPSEQTRDGDMLYRRFGRTKERVSVLGLGGFHIGTLSQEADSIRLLRTAIDRGVTFMDNCWDYLEGRSEEWMGKALQDGYRDKVFLMTKFDGRTRKAAAEQIDESLKRLHTDCVDLMQIHEIIRLEDADRCFAEDGAMEAVQAAQKAGKIRHVGFTGHKDPLVHNRMLDVAARHKFRFDACQLPVNVLDASFRSFSTEVVPRLIQEGIAVLGMKPMAGGAIVQHKLASPKECLSYALTLPTSVVISGIDKPELLEENLEIVKNFKPLDEAELNSILSRTREPAGTGRYEKFKTDVTYDATTFNPHWLG